MKKPPVIKEVSAKNTKEQILAAYNLLIWELFNKLSIIILTLPNIPLSLLNETYKNAILLTKKFAHPQINDIFYFIA